MAANPLFINFELNFLEEIENVENQQRLILYFRNIRDTSNPFELPNNKFVKLFRLNKTAGLGLIEELQTFVDEPTRRDTIPFHLQVFTSLLFYAHGGYQTTVGEDYNLGMSQPAVSRILNKISNLISTHLLPRYIKFPTTNEEVRKVKEGFLNEGFQFPNVIGTIDCTHIAIVPPKIDDPINPAVAYLNRKGFHSINVQAIFDSKLRILNVNARYPGAVHDSAIWEASSIQRHLKRKYEEGRRNNYLLGDSGYPIQPWLMTPILDALPNTPEAMYNERHIITRNGAERGFGLWKARFRCLRKDRVLHYSHGTAARIIYSCAVLHNICRKYNLQEDFDDNSDDDGNDDDAQNNYFDENNINNEELGNLTKLETFGARHNKITKLPNGICNLENLRWLTLEDNNLYTIPRDFDKLQSLIHVNFNKNNFNFIPIRISKIKSLKYLHLQSNEFFSLPESSVLAMSHTKINLQNNPFQLENNKIFANVITTGSENEIMDLLEQDSDSSSENWDNSLDSSELNYSATESESEDEEILTDIPRLSKFLVTF